MFPSLTHLVLRVETAEYPITGTDPVHGVPPTEFQKTLIIELARDDSDVADDSDSDVADTIFTKIATLRFLAVYLHGFPPRFWSGEIERVPVEEGEETLRAEGLELRVSPQVAPLAEPDDIEGQCA